MYSAEKKNRAILFTGKQIKMKNLYRKVSHAHIN